MRLLRSAWAIIVGVVLLPVMSVIMAFCSALNWVEGIGEGE